MASVALPIAAHTSGGSAGSAVLQLMWPVLTDCLRATTRRQTSAQLTRGCLHCCLPSGLQHEARRGRGLQQERSCTAEIMHYAHARHLPALEGLQAVEVHATHEQASSTRSATANEDREAKKVEGDRLS